MELYKTTKYYDILVSEDKKIMEVKWKKSIIELLEDEYKEVLLEAYSHAFDIKPELLLQNAAESVYPFTSSLQEWITKNITKEIFEKVKIKKIAYLIPSDLLSKLALKHLMNKANQESKDIIRLYFDDYQQAINWLRS